jgi:uncharacterized protein YdaU (DUF1376 family)
MHYYQFNIGDYASHTQHLDELEDLAYRRMIDYCYLNECGLPETVEQIARVIRMRTHCERIANVLKEFFYQHKDGTFHSKRADAEIAAFHAKAEKCANAARKRWGNADADALRTHSERNAKHKPLTNNHKPITKDIIAPPVKPATPPVIELMTNRVDHVYGVTMDDYRLFVESYPAVDVQQELLAIRAWLHANPTKRKTASGMARFINTWLSKTQNSGGSRHATHQRSSDKTIDWNSTDWAAEFNAN